MHTDRPLMHANQDRLGFEETAVHLANAITSDKLTSGFVFGVEGPWGSGKSSLINLTQEKLRQRPNSSKLQIIDFRPWLVGKREDLLKELFNQISGVVHNVVDHPHAGDARRLLKTYAQVASGLAGIAAAAEVFEVPLAGKVKGILRSTGRKAGDMANLSLGDIKDNLKAVLKKARAPIIIFIDDLDRLDPPEVVEVLRLVRAVADFPNVVYVTAYDADRISTHLNTELGTDDGGTYMEKVIQVSFRIPKPMTFDLVNWFEEEAARLLAVIPEDSARNLRFDRTVQTWAPILLATPRDVVRARNALQLHAVPVQGKVDPGDMVFLQLIRMKYPELFKWVEDYVANLSRLGDGRFLPRGVPERKGAELLRIIEGDDQHKSYLTQCLSKILPGIDTWCPGQDEDKYAVYPRSWSDAERSLYSRDKRLASRHHFRLYFSFSVPAGGISDVEVVSFVAIVKDAPAAALEAFTEMAQEERPQGGMLAEVLLSRILEQRDRLELDDIPAILEVLGKGMDVLARNANPRMGRGAPRFLRGDESSVFGRLIQRLDEPSRKAVLEKLFKPGISYSWLCEIIRHSTFEHGLHGDRAKPEEKRLLTTDDFNMIRQLYLGMIRNEEPGTLVKIPYFLEFLYSWQQLLDDQDDKEEVRKWVDTQSETNEGLLNLLESMKRAGPEPGIKLELDEIEGFFCDVAQVEQRLVDIAEDEQSLADMRDRARTIKTAIDAGKAFRESLANSTPVN